MKAVKPLATSDQESRKLKASAITERVQDKHPEHLGTRQLARNQDKRFKGSFSFSDWDFHSERAREAPRRRWPYPGYWLYPTHPNTNVLFL